MELSTDVLIVGGGTGAVAAALAIARAGRSCVMVETTDWIGGQLTSQAVPPDENRWIEGDQGSIGATASYLAFRNAVRQWYCDHRSLTDEARSNPRLNPGNGWVSHLCHEPRIGHEIISRMLSPHVDAGRVRIILEHEPIAADVTGDLVRSVTFRNVRSNDQLTVSAQYFLEATELGDLMPLAGIEYAVGAEGVEVHGEMHVRTDGTDPLDQQAITWCFAVEHRPGEDHTIDKPGNYDFWRDYIPKFNIPWPGKLFSWTVESGDDHRPREFRFVPWPDEGRENELEMWRYRRIVDRHHYIDDGSAPADVALFNVVQMDYWLKPLLDVSPEAKAIALAGAKEQSLAFLYWLQTETPRHDGTGAGYPGLKLRGDEIGTPDGFAKHPYIRESRRLLSKTIVTERHVGTEQRRAEKRPNPSAMPWGTAEPFDDSVGIGHYRLDLHPSTAMRNSLYVQAAPFRIPMAALIPKRMRNVLAAGKGLGVTHITNGCFRLHPIEWNIGESAGALAAYCLNNNLEPHQVYSDKSKVRDFQAVIAKHGIPLAWAWEQNENL